MKSFFLLLIIFFSGLPVAAAQVIIEVPVMKANLPLYAAFVAEKGGDPSGITDFVSPYSNRVVVDMVLIQQALLLGGMDVTVHFYATPNPARAEADVKSGKAVLLGFDTWSSSFDDKVYMSDPVLSSGEFLKVIVGRADNKKLMAVRSLEDLRKFTALTGHRWNIDRLTLKKIGIPDVTLVARYDLQIAMLQKGRADFGLFEYPNTEVELPKGLAVVQGVTIGLEGSRHFMVSKQVRNGYFVFNALQKGLAILKSHGIVRKAYIECGFISPLLESWTRLNSPSTQQPSGQ